MVHYSANQKWDAYLRALFNAPFLLVFTASLFLDEGCEVIDLAARLAGCPGNCSKKLHFLSMLALILYKPARDGLKGDLNREQEKTCQPRHFYYQTSYHCVRIYPSSYFWRFPFCGYGCSFMAIGLKSGFARKFCRSTRHLFQSHF